MNMSTLSDLLAQKAAIEKQIADAQREARSAAIAEVRNLMAEHGLTASDLGARGPAAPRKGGGGKVPAKFRDPATGDTWSGRGLKPKWLQAALAAGRTLAEFAI